MTEQSIITMNKHIHAWVFTFLLGAFGVDRFVRGQIGLGLLKLFLGWVTFGTWALVDFIIALVKAYGGDYADTDDFTFIDGKYSI